MSAITQIAQGQVPRLLTLGAAAHIAGLSHETFAKRYLKPRLVETEHAYGPRPYVLTASLEKALGRKISLAELVEADRQLQIGRDRQQRYRERHAPAA